MRLDFLAGHALLDSCRAVLRAVILARVTIKIQHDVAGAARSAPAPPQKLETRELEARRLHAQQLEARRLHAQQLEPLTPPADRLLSPEPAAVDLGFRI